MPAANSSIQTERATRIRQLFPSSVPRLWCPLLTHYREDGQIDRERMAAHLKFVGAHVRGFLVPGSTGDGWEMSDREADEVINLVHDHLPANASLLVGILKRSTREMLERIGRIPPRILAAPQFSGITVCSPEGRDVSASDMESSFSRILDLGHPTAVYQLPQITQNEIPAAALKRLADRYPNFILFKDSSGKDRVAESRLDFAGVFLTRGAEEDYARWLKPAGPYDGLLLSTANCFAAPLAQLVALPSRDEAAARSLSDSISAVVREVFALVSAVAHGNPFANANKACDHYFAFGPGAVRVPPPRLHAGVPLPKEIIVRTGEVLARHGLMPTRGYLE